MIIEEGVFASEVEQRSCLIKRGNLDDVIVKPAGFAHQDLTGKN